MRLHIVTLLVVLLSIALPSLAHAQSCAGSCGGDGGGCWCDDSCFDFGDCCGDICTWCPGTEGCGGGGAGSCAGACGGDGGGCWCDESCFNFDDCCSDICNFCGNLDGCGGGPQPTNSCAGNCNGSGGDCWCDDMCFDNNDCCSDVCTFCDLDGCGGGPQPGGGDCCSANGTPGCDNPSIQNCVCAQDAYCCDTEWDSICAGEVEDFGCGDCGGGGGDSCPGYTGDSACCTTDDPCGWGNDGICDCNSTCGWDSGDCDGGPQPGGGDCCSANGTPGCDTPSIQNCVCAQDAYCCDTEWDDICVGEVEEFGCGSCGGGPQPGGGDCCSANGTPGCDTPSIQNCVCAQDAYCCDTEWDDICAGEVEDFGCGDCGGGGGDKCPGYTGDSGCCETDDPCGWGADGICDCQGTCDWDGPDCGGPGPGGGDCCAAHDGPGCDDASIQNCVCAQDDYCCATQWDDICVGEVEEFGCGSCGGGPGPGSGDCCAAHANPGCDDAAIQNCVCAQDSFCCDNEWDNICAGEVEDFGCGDCGGAGGSKCPGYTGDSGCCETDDPCGWGADGICDCEGSCSWDDPDCGGGPGPGGGDCCAAHDGAGCDDASIQNCVCAQDDYCCATQWDDICVGEVEEFGCGSCGGGPGPGSGDCCEANGTPGCSNATIESCVCQQDSYCCDTEWDSICVDEVEDFGCGECGGGGGGKCPGYSGSSPCCETDDPCGWGADGICDCQGACSWDEPDCGGGPGPGGDCCAVHDAPGCDDGAIEECVCAQDGFCCQTQWDDICVGEVEELGCGSCGGGPGPGAGDCCESHQTAGCDNAVIQDCVCAQDSFCCDNQWDSICVDEVDSMGCGSCAGGGSDTCPGYNGESACCKTDDPCGWGADGICDCEGACGWDDPDCGGGPGPGGDCCTAKEAPGCDDAAVEACVCAQDDYCCQTAWDSLCVDEVGEFGCGECGGGPGPGPGSCCEPQQGPGCDNPSIQACVCNVDSFCCEFTWDSICVDEVESEGCGSCSGGGCGDGQCAPDEDCLICPDDCGQCEGSNCCQPHDTPGCEDGAVQACVCEADAYCCDVEWDGICVDEVTSLGCGSCDGGGPECGNDKCEGGETCKICPEDCGECAGGGGDCCQPHDTPGCDDPAIQACVCALDAYCCDVEWDDICVDGVAGGDCGVCGGCQPDCAGKVCGSDGCQGMCGQCANGESCKNGKCVQDGCQPNCDGKQCGPDGCGGSCGSCPNGTSCINGKCGGCTPKCGGKQCGDDGCGGSCGTCPPGFFCQDGHCGQQCKPDCTGKQCGSDGCGGTCGSCPSGFYCTPGGLCEEKCVPACAGKQCGTDGCGGSCGSCPDGYMCNAGGHCSSSCQANCTGKQCGDDGCGGSCGSCKEDEYCNLQGHCVSGCTPDCMGKECGSDGCGGSCGNCGFGQICDAVYKCEDVCQPNCLNKECGADGCGSTCGICGGGHTCTEQGLCISCTADCSGKVCGDDGCGGECGMCPQPLVCWDKAGTCVTPEEIPDDNGDDAWAGEWDGWGEVGGNGGTLCGEGERLLYGKCVPMEGEDPPEKDSGCSAGAGSDSPSSNVWLLLAGLGLAVLARRRREPQTYSRR